MALNQEVFEKLGVFYLGRHEDDPEKPVLYDSRDLLTHAMCIGMTGSGKTGLCLGLLEEAILDDVPAIIIDPKGDLGNLLLTFPELQPSDFLPWMNEDEARRKSIDVDTLAKEKATLWKSGLESWGQDGDRIKRLKNKAKFSIFTPGSSAGLPVSILSSLGAPSAEIIEEPEFLSDQVAGTVRSFLGLMNEDLDSQSPIFVFLGALFEHFWKKNESLDIGSLINAVQHPPIDKIGFMDLDSIFEPKKRLELAKKINNLAASPGFSAWLEGEPLDIPSLLFTDAGQPRVSIFSISHLDDNERMFFVSTLLNQMVSWMRTQSGTTSLKALLYMDEIYGYLPPVANPPTKAPFLTLLKQARAFGIGLVLATQNPSDIDYKALSNAGTWFLGRLQTKQDRDRVVSGLINSGGQFSNRKVIDDILSGLESRSFMLHNVHEDAPVVFQTRWVMSYMKGPLTRNDIRVLMEPQKTEVKTQQAIMLSGDAPTAAPMQVAAPITAPKKDSIRPLVPEGITEFFMKPGIEAQKPSTLLYRPMIYAWGSSYFDDAKFGLDQNIQFGMVHGLQMDPLILDWSKAFRVDLDPAEFSTDPEDGSFMDLPKLAGKKASYTKWSRSVVDYLYREEQITCWQCPKLRLKSQGSENQSAFVQRVRDVVREKRDNELDKLRDRYEKKIKTAQTRLQKAEHTLETQEDQARTASVDAAVTIGTSIFGAFFGRKSTRAISTGARRGSRAMKEKRDVARAEENYREASQTISDLNLECEEKLKEAANLFSMDEHPIEEVLVSVKKKNVSVDVFCLVWVPYWVCANGEKELAVSY